MYYSPIERVVSVLAPYACLLCRVEEDALCRDCQREHLKELESRCYKCNKITKQSAICTSCRSSSRLRRVWWLGEYEELIKHLVKEMKFKRRRSHARMFGQVLDDALPYLPENTVVTSVPTAYRRIRQRGFDQAALIARSFAVARGYNYRPLLFHAREVEQIGKNRRERLQQVAESMRYKGGELNGVPVLIVDDVLTTGASLEVAAGILREHGAPHVDGAVIARHLLK